MGKVSEKVKEEFLAMIPPTNFFFVTPGLGCSSANADDEGNRASSRHANTSGDRRLGPGQVGVDADMLPIINRYPDKPLAYNIVWKTAIYVLVALVIHYLERLVDFWKEAGGFVAGNEKLLAEMVWSHFWAIQILLIVLIFDYCVMHELARVIGVTKLREMFFGKAADAATVNKT